MTQMFWKFSFLVLIFATLVVRQMVYLAPVEGPCGLEQETIFLDDGTVTCLECKGEFYISNGECLPCTNCDRSQWEAVPCSQKQDRVCACRNESYFDPHTHSCRQCTKCMPGEAQAAPCGPGNRVCVECPEGKISFEKNAASCVLMGPHEETKKNSSLLKLAVTVVIPLAVVTCAIVILSIVVFRRKKRLRPSDPNDSMELPPFHYKEKLLPVDLQQATVTCGS